MIKNQILMEIEAIHQDQMMNHPLILMTEETEGPKGGAQKSIPPHRRMIPPFLQMRNGRPHLRKGRSGGEDIIMMIPPQIFR